MTKKEYLQFLEKSEIFQDMAEEFRQILLAAEEDAREDYVEILTTTEADLAKAKKEFVQEATNAVKTMNTSAKKYKRDFAIVAEKRNTDQEGIEAEALLKSL